MQREVVTTIVLLQRGVGTFGVASGNLVLRDDYGKQPFYFQRADDEYGSKEATGSTVYAIE